MSFFAILFALLIEQARPLKDENFFHTQVRSALSWAVRQLDTGQSSHARLTWAVVVLIPAALSAVVHWALLLWLGWMAALVWNVGVLYLTLGLGSSATISLISVMHLTPVMKTLRAVY